MDLLNRNPHCKRCGYDLDGGEISCPECSFRPREKGLKISMAFLMGVVIFMTVTMVMPRFGPILIRFAGLSFLASLVAFAIAFTATPYRFGSVFARLDRD